MSGHPLPASDEARAGEVPESVEAAKGHGDDDADAAQTSRPVNPDGTHYDVDPADGAPSGQEQMK